MKYDINYLDSHETYNQNSERYTIPQPGWYNISVNCQEFGNVQAMVNLKKGDKLTLDNNIKSEIFEEITGKEDIWKFQRILTKWKETLLELGEGSGYFIRKDEILEQNIIETIYYIYQYKD